MSSVASSQVLQEHVGERAKQETGLRAEKKSPRRPWLILAAVAVLAIGLYGIIEWWSRSKESTDDAQVDADVVNVSARVGGQILKVHVGDNQQVHKGQLLIELDPADRLAKDKQAAAELAAARARASAADARVGIVEATSRGGLKEARAELLGSASSVTSADAQVASAKALVAQREAEASQGDSEYGRAEALAAEKAIAPAQRDAARSAALSARAAVAQAKAQLTAAEDMKRTAQARIAQSEARVEQSAPVDAQLASARAQAELEHANVDAAVAALDVANLELSYTRIEAPADGTLSRLAVREGQLVQAGQPIVVIVPDKTYVVANFKETQVGKMHPGQRVEISVDAFPGQMFTGTVESTSPGTGARFSLLAPDNASGNFVKVVQRMPVKIAWTHLPSDVRLAAGLSADVTVELGP
jgi:membrane fusion protein (multidrug efflux system)